MTNSDGQDIIEETGDGIYHKYYETENEKVETIDNKTRTTETITDDDYTTKTRYLVNNYYSTFFKNTDKFGRITSERVIRNNKTSDYDIYNKEYSYESSGSGKTSERVSQITYTGGYNRTIKYGYDASGNISEIDGIKYGYDEAGQLISETNEIGRLNRKYTYDKGGNITELKKYVNGKLTQTNTYTYGNSDWKDLLTAYNGNKITYDEIGNPLTYYNGMKFSWTMGRRLKSVKNGNANISYAYNVDGLRTRKVISGIQFNYYWNGDKLTGQTWHGNTLYFYYDKDGNPIGFDYNNNHYYYITNLQGDIIAILDVNGNLMAEYEYDSWGNCTILQNLDNIANTNPLRYRGYYYDSDTGLYYLQSRYYDSNIGRFINSDEVEMVQHDDENLFSYTSNNYIMYNDPYGTGSQKIMAAPTAKDLDIITWSIKNSGLNKKRYATLNYFSGSRKSGNSTIYTFTSTKKTHFYKTEYYVIKKTRKQWYKYIKDKYGKLQSVNKFFNQLELELGDPVWDAEPSVSKLASALSKIAKIINLATMPREANYIIDMMRKYDNSKNKKIRNTKNIYIPNSAHIYDCYWGKKYIFFGKKVLKYSYNKWAYPY